MKKTIKYLILVIIIILIVVIVVIIGNQPKSVSLKNPDKLISGEAQAQSYITEKMPVLEEGDLFFGSEQAALKIFVYEDYSNIYSAQLADTLEKIRQELGNRVAIIVRPYVLDDSLLSRQAALAIECAGKNDKWMKMRALLFSQIKNNQLLSEDFVSEIKQLKLDNDEFQTCLTNPEKLERIEQTMKMAKQYEVLGAPTLFVGDEMILGARPYEDYIDSNGDAIEGLRAVVDRKLP